VAIIVGGKIATKGSPARLKAALGGESINLLLDSRETAEKAFEALKGTGDRQQLDRDVVRLYMPVLPRQSRRSSTGSSWEGSRPSP